LVAQRRTALNGKVLVFELGRVKPIHTTKEWPERTSQCFQMCCTWPKAKRHTG